MGMTIWMHTLEGRAYSKDSDDHSSMCRYSDELDALSEQLEVKQLSAFFDYSDQALNSGGDGDDVVSLDPLAAQTFDFREALLVFT